MSWLGGGGGVGWGVIEGWRYSELEFEGGEGGVFLFVHGVGSDPR